MDEQPSLPLDEMEQAWGPEEGIPLPAIDPFWLMPADLTSTAAKLKVIGIDPAFLDPSHTDYDDFEEALKYAFTQFEEFIEEMREDLPEDEDTPIDHRLFKPRKRLSSR